MVATPENSRSHLILETIATALMAIATIATAWCAYQSTVFSGVEEFAIHDAEVTNRAKYAQLELATELKVLDVSLFTNWANARGNGVDDLETFYIQRFPPRLRVAFDAWIATNPFTDSTAPKHPLAMKEYKVAEFAKADSLQTLYSSQIQYAHEVNGHSEHYILLTVIFASVLFFGGISSNISAISTKKALVIGSAFFLIVSIAWMLTFPMILR